MNEKYTHYKFFNKVRCSITPYCSVRLMIFRRIPSTSSVEIPSEQALVRNSFIPLIKRLHSKSVSFSLVFLLNIKMTSLYLVIPFYKEVCVLSNVWTLKIYLIFKISSCLVFCFAYYICISGYF